MITAKFDYSDIFPGSLSTNLEKSRKVEQIGELDRRHEALFSINISNRFKDVSLSSEGACFFLRHSFPDSTYGVALHCVVVPYCRYCDLNSDAVANCFAQLSRFISGLVVLSLSRYRLDATFECFKMSWILRLYMRRVLAVRLRGKCLLVETVQ